MLSPAPLGSRADRTIPPDTRRRPEDQPPGGHVRMIALGALAFLCYPALKMAAGPLAPGRLAATGLATLTVMGLYLWVVWRREWRDRVRRRAALAALAVMAGLGVAVPAVWGPSWTGLLLFPAVAAAVVLPAAVGVLTACGLAAVIAGEGTALGAEGGFVLSLGLVTVLAGLAVAGYVRLAETNARLREAQAKIAGLVAAEERARIGRDLHDSVKQHLFVASMRLGTVRMELDASPADARSHLDEAARAVSDAKSELSGLIHQTRPAEGDPVPLAAALRELVSAWSSRSGIRAEFSATGSLACPPETGKALAQACREALANVLRHAHATVVQVRLHGGESGAEVRIADDGAGFGSGRSRGHGLAIMRERLAEAGGAAEVRSTPGNGTEVLLRWPAGREETRP